MATYIAYLSINDTDGRSKNFTTAPTVTVWNGRTKAAITTPSPTLSNITTGLYSVDIELATKTDVLFKIVPHADDEDDIQDIKVIHEGYIETVEELGSTLGTIDNKVSAFIDLDKWQVQGSGAANGVYTHTGGSTYLKQDADGIMALEHVSGVWKIYDFDTPVIIYYTATSNAETPDLVDNWELGAYGTLPLPKIAPATSVRLSDTQGEIQFERIRIINNKNDNAALEIENLHEDAVGVSIYGGYGGQFIGGGIQAVSGFDPAIKTGLALEATLNAMKGEGWTDETLVALMEAIGSGGGGGMTPEQLRAALGMALANLDTQLGNIKTETASIKSKTDTIPANPAKVGDAMTLTSAYDAAKVAASQSSVSAIPTTPLLAANYTAPDNAGITAIKAKTDNLPAQPAAKGDIPSVVNIQSGLAKTSELTPLAKTTDLSGLAKTTDLSGLAKTTDLSGLATEANATANKNTIVTAITNKPVTPATDISGLATEANATTNKNTIVTAINNKPVTPATDTSALAKSSELTGLAKTSDLTGLAEKDDIPADYAKEITLQDVKDQTDQLTFTVPGSVDATAVVDTSVLATSAELELVADNVTDIKNKTNQFVFTVPGKVDANAVVDVSGLAADLLALDIEDGLDLKSVIRVVLAFASGVSEGGGSKTIKYKDTTGTVNRIVWTVDKFGDRLTSELDGSDV